MTPGHCDIGFERRKEQVAAKGGGAPVCVADRQEARSPLPIKRRSYVLSSFVEHAESPLALSIFFVLHIFKF